MMSSEERVQYLEKSIRFFLAWLKEHRPTVPGLGAPIMMLQQALDGDLPTEVQKESEEQKTKKLIRETVCSSCCSSAIVDADCICVYRNTYPVIELEFEQCSCCGHIDSHPANTDFNNLQFQKYNGTKE